MCFGGDSKEAPAPAPPPETLKQAAPVKKTSDASDLSIGTKKYQTITSPDGTTRYQSGKQMADPGTQKYRTTPQSTGVKTVAAPSGIAVNY
jgi:hypothetical protein